MSLAFVLGYGVCFLGLLRPAWGAAVGRVVAWLPRYTIFIVRRIAKMPYAALLMAGLDGVKKQIDPEKNGWGPYDYNLFQLPEEEKAKLLADPRYEAMPAYPYYGSVQKIDDFIVVKLG